MGTAAAIPFAVVGTATPALTRPRSEPIAVVDPFRPIYERGDRVIGWLVAGHLLIAGLLAPIYDTWRVTAVVGLGFAALFYICMFAAPGRFLTRSMAGLVLQGFCALHIYQMRGMAEMHFFFFTAVTAMIVYQDPRAMWLGVLAIIGQHTLFSVWHNAGIHPGGQMFFEPHTVSLLKISLHFGIALAQVAFAAYCARAWRRQTERSFAASDLTQRLARVSHELRTPLNAIGGYVDLLDLGVRGELTPEQRGDVKRIKMNNRHLLDVVDNILDYARIEAGSASVSVEPVSASAIIESLEPLIGSQVASQRLAFVIDECDKNLLVLADAPKTRQILLNLVANSVKFTPCGGSIFVGCRAVGDSIELSVRDTGPGIPANKLDTIFEPFVQLVDTAMFRQRSGVGLGLAISRHLARMMNGELRVESMEGSGSTFTLSLPCSQ
jgi:signal transduction histidine kinase